VNSSAVDSRSVGQEISHLLLSPKVNYCVHKSLLLDLNLSQLNPVYDLTSNLSILFHWKGHSSLTATNCKIQRFETDIGARITYRYLANNYKMW